jgi:hypothetical protein
LPYDDVRSLLHFLFSDNPRKNGYGIFVAFDNDKFQISFKGCLDFPLTLVTDEAIACEFQKNINKINAETKQIFEEGVANANRIYEEDLAKAKQEYEADCRATEPCNSEIKPNKDYL